LTHYEKGDIQGEGMKRYRKKTDLEIALSPIISSFGRIPTPKELGRILGGDRADWGRIIKGQQKISGEYHARLKLLKDGIDDAQFQLQAAKRSREYGGCSRKGRLVPHTNYVFNDLDNFDTNSIIESRAGKIHFEDAYDYYDFCRNQEADIYMGGYQHPRDYFEEQTLRRVFINSLS
jgi:hypothetical protein